MQTFRLGSESDNGERWQWRRRVGVGQDRCCPVSNSLSRRREVSDLERETGEREQRKKKKRRRFFSPVTSFLGRSSSTERLLKVSSALSRFVSMFPARWARERGKGGAVCWDSSGPDDGTTASGRFFVSSSQPSSAAVVEGSEQERETAARVSHRLLLGPASFSPWTRGTTCATPFSSGKSALIPV